MIISIIDDKNLAEVLSLSWYYCTRHVFCDLLKLRGGPYYPKNVLDYSNKNVLEYTTPFNHRRASHQMRF